MTEETPPPNQIVCPYCKRLITLPAVSFGTKEKCPHCDIEFVVSSRLIPQTSQDKENLEVNHMEGYGLQSTPGDATATAPSSPALKSRLSQQQDDNALVQEKATWRPMATPPPGLFLKSTFLFPFTAGPRLWYLILLLLAGAAEAGVQIAIYLAGFSGGMEIADKWIASMILTSLSIIIGVFALLVASAVCMTIIHETAEGIDKFNDQQLGWFTEWLQEAIYLAANLFYGAAPAIVLLFVLPVRPALKVPIYLFSEIFLFPLFLMSALERKSAATPYSKPVWKSLYYAWHAWVLFYLLTLLIGETFVYLLRIIPFAGINSQLLYASLLLPFLLMVYFRLLGRLAWFCSGRFEEELKIHRSGLP